VDHPYFKSQGYTYKKQKVGDSTVHQYTHPETGSYVVNEHPTQGTSVSHFPRGAPPVYLGHGADIKEATQAAMYHHHFAQQHEGPPTQQAPPPSKPQTISGVLSENFKNVKEPDHKESYYSFSHEGNDYEMHINGDGSYSTLNANSGKMIDDEVSLADAVSGIKHYHQNKIKPKKKKSSHLSSQLYDYAAEFNQKNEHPGVSAYTPELNLLKIEDASGTTLAKVVPHPADDTFLVQIPGNDPYVVPEGDGLDEHIQEILKAGKTEEKNPPPSAFANHLMKSAPKILSWNYGGKNGGVKINTKEGQWHLFKDHADEYHILDPHDELVDLKFKQPQDVVNFFKDHDLSLSVGLSDAEDGDEDAEFAKFKEDALKLTDSLGELGAGTSMKPNGEITLSTKHGEFTIYKPGDKWKLMEEDSGETMDFDEADDIIEYFKAGLSKIEPAEPTSETGIDAAEDEDDDQTWDEAAESLSKTVAKHGYTAHVDDDNSSIWVSPLSDMNMVAVSIEPVGSKFKVDLTFDDNVDAAEYSQLKNALTAAAALIDHGMKEGLIEHGNPSATTDGVSKPLKTLEDALPHLDTLPAHLNSSNTVLHFESEKHGDGSITAVAYAAGWWRVSVEGGLKFYPSLESALASVKVWDTTGVLHGSEVAGAGAPPEPESDEIKVENVWTAKDAEAYLNYITDLLHAKTQKSGKLINIYDTGDTAIGSMKVGPDGWTVDLYDSKKVYPTLSEATAAVETWLDDQHEGLPEPKPKIAKAKVKTPGPAGAPPVAMPEGSFTPPEDWVHVKHIAAAGSGGVTVYETPHGKVAVKQATKSKEHLHEEYLTEAMYRAAEVAVPSLQQIGPVAKVNAFVEGVTLAETSGIKRQKALKKLRADFVVDAWLANWDVAGPDLANVIVTPDGDVYRIDNGGGLRRRAGGTEKLLSEEVKELESMRSPSYAAGKVFGGMEDEEVADQIEAKVPAMEKALLEMSGTLPPALKATLEKRLKWMRNWAKEIKTGHKTFDDNLLPPPQWPTSQSAPPYHPDEGKDYKEMWQAWQATFSSEHKAAIQSWKGSSTGIRQCLKNPTKCSGEQQRKYAKAIDEVAKSGPTVRKTLWRGIQVSNAEQYVKQLQKNGGFMTETVSGASTNSGTAKSFGNVILVFDTVSAVDVHNIGNHASETEWLVRRHRVFELTEPIEKSGTFHIVHLKEVGLE
jgi:hypothetical protein